MTKSKTSNTSSNVNRIEKLKKFKELEEIICEINREELLKLREIITRAFSIGIHSLKNCEGILYGLYDKIIEDKCMVIDVINFVLTRKNVSS